MERVVKFRGKTLSGKWVYGDLVHFTNTQGIDTSVIITEHQATAESDDFDYALCYARNEFKIVVPETVGQFTELLDKNGKEIYFDDIVRNKYGDIGSVIWFSDWSLRVDWGGGDIHFIDPEWGLEVIGNIIDNPNLLTDGRD